MAIAIFAAAADASADTTLDSIAESYVKLVLRVGQYDEYMVDSYFGPDDWIPGAPPDENLEPPYDAFLAKAKSLTEKLRSIDTGKLVGLQLKRYRYLESQLAALIGRIEMLAGKTMTFDEETRTMYDVTLPAFNKTYYDSLLQELDRLVPGEGSVAERFNTFMMPLRIPNGKVEQVFNVGVAAARERVSNYLDIPKGDSVSIETVTGQWWTADCRYRGNGHSHMQLNIDRPFYLDQAITFPCHEIYPGHHLSFLYIDKYLLGDNGWVEFSLIPSFSPLSALLEGIAEYGIDLAFPKAEWIEFAETTLCPIAEIDTSLIEPFYDMWQLKYQLYPVESHIARQYLSGEIDSTKAKEQLIHYAIYSEDEVDARVGAYDSWRSYVVNYYVGKDLVSDHIEAVTEGADDRNAQWETFVELLKTPLTPANLVKKPAELVIDHIYICVSSQAPEAKVLQDAGLQLASDTAHHTGQGTAAVLFYFDNIYLELIWIEDAEELESADKQLADKFRNVSHDGSPFGLGLRNSGPSNDSLPFDTRGYFAEWMRPGTTIEIVDPLDQSEPDIFVEPPYLGWDSLVANAPSDWPKLLDELEHTAGMRRLTGIRIFGPGLPTTSKAISVLIEQGIVDFGESEVHVVELTFDEGKRGKVIDARPTLPVVIYY